MITPANTTLFLLQLRSLMTNISITGTDKPVSAYIIPLADAHNGESIAACDRRLQFISGFSGSAGSAVITQKEALLWTDGRYFTQAGLELDENWKLMKDKLPDTPSPGEYLNRKLEPGSLVGVDPFLYSKADWDALSKILRLESQTLFPVEQNLVDIVWSSKRPNCPKKSVFPLEIQFTGRSMSDKLKDVRQEMQAETADAVVLSELDDIAWLLNLRGRDLDSASVFISYLIIQTNNFQLFIDSDKLKDPVVTSKIREEGGEIFAYEEIGPMLGALIRNSTGKVWLSNKCNYALVRRVPERRQIVKLTPLALLKAVKNDVEVEGMRSALKKDGTAIVRFLVWLENSVQKGENVTEISAAEKLLSFRKESENFITTSFTTISAVGSNAAVIHYHPSPSTDRQITATEMYLIDSGGIYKDGTTDITRTLHFGTPTGFQKDCYTRVLKGQIAIATSVFPNKIKASRLDAFARSALWKVGLDYNHGTGHGIGHALNVHEGPSFMRDHHIPDDPGYRHNMFTSNEPGFYKEGEFGIRLENIIRVVNVTLTNNFQNQGFLGFEDMTFVPYRHNLINLNLLTLEEIGYLNKYQEKTRQTVGDHLKKTFPSDPAYDWLIKETQLFPLHRS